MKSSIVLVLSCLILTSCVDAAAVAVGELSRADDSPDLAVSPDMTLTVSTFCDGLQSSWCAPAVSCGFYRNVADCDADPIRVREGNCWITQGEVDNGAISFNPFDAEDCLTNFYSSTAPCDWAFPTTCSTLSTGNVASGNACASNRECVSGDKCTASTLTCPGTCQTGSAGGSGLHRGDTCSSTPPCQAGGLSVCNGRGTASSSTGTCGARSDTGGGCIATSTGFDRDTVCFEDSYCRMDNAPVSGAGLGTCRVKGQIVGDACWGQQSCVPGLRCAGWTTAPANGTCQTAIADGSGTCTWAWDCAGYPLSYCDVGSSPHTCQPTVALGGACTLSMACGSVAYGCFGGTCQVVNCWQR